MPGKILTREVKTAFHEHIRGIIRGNNNTIMILTRPVMNKDDCIVAFLSPNIMKRIPDLPLEFQGFSVIYEELEPFYPFTRSIDQVL